MHIIKISGGLGNQMFQYAFAKALTEKAGMPTMFDVGSYDVHKDRAFGLNEFQTDLPVASKKDIVKVLFPDNFLMRLLAKSSRFFWKYSKERVSEKGQYEFDKTLLQSHPTSTYFDGHWQNERYFKDIAADIRRDFSFSRPLYDANEQMLGKIQNAVSVSLHIRRGDYVNIPTVGGICDATYFARAIEYISNIHKEASFFVFSDDLSWAKGNLPTGHDYIYVESNASHPPIDIHLMSQCKHHIIANSTFSWWGAWLNSDPQKIVVAPKLWHRNYADADIVPPEWVKI